MSVPPVRKGQPLQVRDEQSSERSPARKPDRLGPLMVGAVLVVLVVALVLLFLL